MIYCMKCGSKLPDEAKFCKYCGTSTHSVEETEKKDVDAESTSVQADAIASTSPQKEVETNAAPKVATEPITIPKEEVSETVVESVATPDVEVITIDLPKEEVVQRHTAKEELVDYISSPKVEVKIIVTPIDGVETRSTPKVEIIETRSNPKIEAEAVVTPTVESTAIITTQKVELAEPVAVHEAEASEPETTPKKETEVTLAPNESEVFVETPYVPKHKVDVQAAPKTPETVFTRREDFRIKETPSVPFDRHRPKSSSFFIDNEFHGGLARKNIGGIYNESLDIIEGGKWGYVDSSKREVIAVVYDKATNFRDGYAKVSMNGSTGIINKKGKEIIPLIYKDTTLVTDGMVGVCVNNKWGFVDLKGNKVIPFKYSNVTAFENGVAKACKNGRWGMIDKNDNVVVPFMYNDINQFENNPKVQNKYKKELPYSDNRSFLYKGTVGIAKAWAAFIGEAVFLFLVNQLLPNDKTNIYWMLVGVTIVVSFLLFYIIITTVKNSIKEKVDL